MSENNNYTLLDFDTDQAVEVKFPGKVYAIRPQDARTIQSVLELSNADSERTIDTEPARFIESVFANWPDVVQAVGLMLGLGTECNDNLADYQVLRLHLNPARATKIFWAWWRTNEIEDFFGTGGRALTPQADRERILRVRQEAERLAVAAALEAVAPEAPAQT